MLPNKTCYFSFKYNSPLNIYLVVKDVFEKEYLYHIEVVFLHTVASTGKNFCTIRSIKAENGIKILDLGEKL